MKKFTLPIILLFASFVIAQGAVSAGDQKLLETYGWIMGRQVFSGMNAQFGFNDEENAVLLKGFVDGAKNVGTAPMLEKEEGEKLESYLEGKSNAHQKKVEAEVAKDSKANKDAAKAFFEKLDKEGKAKKTGSGLYYEITKAGSKEMAGKTSTVKIDYVGKLINGTEFDSSKKRGQPVTFNLEGVIPGFNEGLQLIGKGGSIRLYVPSELAYKDTVGLPNIPPGSTLIFDVDLIDILPNDAAKPAISAEAKPVVDKK